MARFLLTGGRAPATLDLARALAAGGHHVVVAESLRGHLSRRSRAVARCYRVPAPNDGLDAFIDALADVARREAIDRIVPTCEELFHVARGRERLAVVVGPDGVFTDSIERLRVVHSKWLFAEKVRSLGLPMPRTERLTTRKALRARVREAGPELVLKPEFSRFASSTILGPGEADVERVEIGEDRAWVAQRRLHGRHLCTWSVAHHGHLTAHSAYGVDYTAGIGSAIVFRSLAHDAAESWVRHFVADLGHTGQIAFDFIDVPGEALYPIECNPRLTSGVHLYNGDPALASAFLDPTRDTLRPPPDRPAMLTLAFAAYALPKVRTAEDLRAAWRVARSCRDAVLDRRDPVPFLWQPIAIGALAQRALRHRISVLEASTLDIEWNGALP